MVYQDHLTKFVMLRPLRRKSAQEVVDNLLDVFCLLGPPHILQSDNGGNLKTSILQPLFENNGLNVK